MKNIEKYTNTKDALKTYDSLDFKRVPFEIWLECEYEGEPTLLEAAKMFTECVEMPYDTQEQKHWDGLCAAIRREKAKPVRNCDRYNTTRSATRKWAEITGASIYAEGDGNDWRKFFHWLYAEAGKEEAK